MAYTYKGEKITGTSTTAKVFKKSGIAKAAKGQTYLNTTTGHVYKCEKGGKPADATWAYTKTAVLSPPMEPVGIKAPVRGDDGSRDMTATWTIPKPLNSDKCCYRAGGCRVAWTCYTNDGYADIHKVGVSDNEKKTSSTLKLSSIKATKPAKTFTRSDFYPYTGRKLLSVECAVAMTNSKGVGGPTASVRVFEKPRTPTLGSTSIDENGKVSCTVTTNPGNDYRERARTRYQVDVYDSRTGKWKNVQDLTNTNTSHTLSYDVADWQVAGKYVKVRFRAKAQGYAGDSDWSAYKVHVVGWPNAATIDEKAVKVPGKSSTSIATFPIKVNQDDNHKTDQVILQKLVNVDYTTAAQATADTEGWVSTDYKDDSNCKALACSVGDLLPDAGKYSWVRVKSWHDIEGVFYTYSKPYNVKALHTDAPTAADDRARILSIGQGANGESLSVLIGWNADGRDDADGTQLSWSDAPDAWNSTDPPETYEFTENDGSKTVSGKTYRGTRTIVVKGLREGEPTYIAARRYMDDADGNRAYGPLSDIVSGIPTVAPSDVVLSAPPFVAAGSGVQFTWAFAGGGTQRAWQLVDSRTGAVIDSGTDAFGTKAVSADRVAAFARNGALSALVRVSTGGGFVESESPVVVHIVDAPALTMAVAPSVTAQPVSLSFTSNVAASLAIVVSAQGGSRPLPDGRQVQPEGDCVWRYAAAPQWTASGGNYTATVEMPEGMALLDGARYTVTATATDRSTGLLSPEASAAFEVAWARKAPEPPDSIEVTPEVLVDEDGKVTRRCTIALAAPEDAESTDLYDIYRVTSDGVYAIGEGYPLDAAVADDYAAFGDTSHAYRIALRTVDGSLAWADYDYWLEGESLRFDFNGRDHTWVELPYNIAVSNSRKKRFEGKVHMDGSKGGGWIPGVDRSASLDTDVLRIDDPDVVAAVRDLALTAGSVFVRTPEGAAFAANVEVDDNVQEAHVLLACSFDAEEIDLTAEWMLPPIEGDEDEEEEGE